MSKTLKIFLFSLFGAVLGVFALGAASNIGRDGDKKDEETVAEEVTLETFQDPTKYTEVEVQAGEYVAGNWYRISQGMGFYLEDVESSGFYLDTGANYGADVDWIVAINRGQPVYDLDFVHKVYAVEGTQAYMDFYVELGASYDFNGTVVEITEESILMVDSTIGISRLVPNA